MRGLKAFISDILKCQCREEETKRVNKELANIRLNFKGNKRIRGYDKKKYVCKLIFIHLMGYQYDIGYLEAVNLLSSNKYSEKKIGYLFISVVMKHNNNLMPLIMATVKQDLASDKLTQNLALQFISNNSYEDIPESLSNHVLNILMSNESCNSVRQTAALTLLKILRNNPKPLQHSSDRIVYLISHRDLGIATAACSLVEFLTFTFPSEYEICKLHAVLRLNKIVKSPPEHFENNTYFFLNAPWTVVKLLRILQNCPFKTYFIVNEELRECLEFILEKAKEPYNVKEKHYNYAKYSIIFEAIRTIIHDQMGGSLLRKAINILGYTLKHKDQNLRFITLDLMTQLSNSEDSKTSIMMHLGSVMDSLRNESNLTLKICLIDLLFNICDISNVKQIVGEMFHFIETQEQSVHEEVVLKAILLIEKFSSDSEWYVTTVFNILRMYPNDRSDTKICYLLINFVLHNGEIHNFAARAAYAALNKIPCRESVVKAAAYILGEFGNLIAKDPRTSQLRQLKILREMNCRCSFSTRAIILTTYMKFINLYPELKVLIQSILKEKINIQSEDEEVQQRATEYLRLSEVGSKTLLETVFEAMTSWKRQKCVDLNVRSDIFQNRNEKSKIPLCNIPDFSSNTYQVNSKIALNSSIRVENTSSNIGKLLDIPSEPSSCILCPDTETMSVVKSVENTSSNIGKLLDIPSEPFSFILCPDTEASSVVKKYQSIPTISNEKCINNLLFNEAGTLYDDELINISLESEFFRHRGNIVLLVKNKSNQSISNFSINRDFDTTSEKCSLWISPVPEVISEEHVVKQYFQLECLNEFTGRPSLNIMFAHNNATRKIQLNLPVTLNKFVEPCVMSLTEFITRWKCFKTRGYEISEDFKAKYPMIYSSTIWRLTGFRLHVIEAEGMDLDNIFCSGMFFACIYRIGFLVRLERYPEENKYRSMVRSSELSICKYVSDLLVELL